MSKPQPTRTFNRIRLTDLEDKRFEDFCLSLVFPISNWTSLNHIGRTGSDGGVDIRAVEALDGGITRTWVIQCKRVEKASSVVAKKAVDEAMAGINSVDVLLLVFACDLSAKARDDYHLYAVSKGVKNPLVWTLSEIEARLFNERKDLLFAYFGISLTTEVRKAETAIRKNISMKQRMRRAFRNKTPDLEKSRREPRHQFSCSNFIIRSIDDSAYPEVDEARNGTISSWFRVETWDYYWNGIEVCLGCETAIVDENGQWAIVRSDDDFDETQYAEIHVIRIGRIPFRNIIDFDEDGDEYYGCPHIYCVFADGGMPYESMVFEVRDQPFQRLDPTKEFKFVGKKSNRRFEKRLEEARRKQGNT